MSDDYVLARLGEAMVITDSIEVMKTRAAAVTEIHALRAGVRGWEDQYTRLLQTRDRELDALHQQIRDLQGDGK